MIRFLRLYECFGSTDLNLRRLLLVKNKRNPFGLLVSNRLKGDVLSKSTSFAHFGPRRGWRNLPGFKRRLLISQCHVHFPSTVDQSLAKFVVAVIAEWLIHRWRLHFVPEQEDRPSLLAKFASPSFTFGATITAFYGSVLHRPSSPESFDYEPHNVPPWSLNIGQKTFQAWHRL